MSSRELEQRLLEKIEELEQKVERQEEKIQELETGKESESSGYNQENEISRRSFLKKLGIGAVGLGALSLSPAASKVTITDSGINKDGSSFWFSGLSSSYDLSGQNITDDGTTVWDTSAGHVPVSQVEQVDGLYADQSGNVAAGNAATATVTELADTETLEINWASFVTTDGQAAPSGVDVIIATFANDGTGTSQVTALSGDGSTVYDDESGSPLASYQNTTGSAQTVSIMVDNGQFNSGSGSDQSIQLSANARVV